MNPFEIIDKYYDKNSKLYNILVIHSKSVRDMALKIAARHQEMNLDTQFISEAAMLHDIGIFMTDAPDIYCTGKDPYIKHGFLGAELMRKEGYPKHARVCERHTGTGITIEQIENQNLPLPLRDFRPETMEEQLICFADKFFSKTHLETTASVEKIQKKLAKYGQQSVDTFNKWVKLFN